MKYEYSFDVPPVFPWGDFSAWAAENLTQHYVTHEDCQGQEFTKKEVHFHAAWKNGAHENGLVLSFLLEKDRDAALDWWLLRSPQSLQIRISAGPEWLLALFEHEAEIPASLILRVVAEFLQEQADGLDQLAKGGDVLKKGDRFSTSLNARRNG